MSFFSRTRALFAAGGGGGGGVGVDGQVRSFQGCTAVDHVIGRGSCRERAERGERSEREEREERTLESVRVLQASSKNTKNNNITTVACCSGEVTPPSNAQLPVVSTLLVPKLLKGPPPPINPSNGSCPSLSPQEPAGQRKGLSAESKERWVLDIVASTGVP